MKLIVNGEVNQALTTLVALQGLFPSPGSSPQALNSLLQERWVKAKEGTFRVDIGGRFPTDDETTLLNELGCVQAMPMYPLRTYRGTLLLGATLKAVVRRVDYMVCEEDRYEADVPQPVYLLGSRRKLNANLEMPEHVQAILEETGVSLNDQWRSDALKGKWPLTESDMLNRVLTWRTCIYWASVVVLAQDGKKADGSSRPANTAETVKEWLKNSSRGGNYLVVSSQPYCENQLMAVERAVREAGKKGYTFDVCGPAAAPMPLARWLDNLAKQLWEEVQLL